MPTASYYDSIFPKNPQHSVNNPIVPLPLPGLGAQSINFGARPHQSSSNRSVPTQAPFLQHMMLGGAYGNYSSQQNTVQSSNAYKQDYAQQCYEEQVFLNQVYCRDPSLKLVFQQNLSEPSVFKTRHYFQSILSVDVNLDNGIDMTILALSDNGACLNFGSEKWFKETH